MQIILMEKVVNLGLMGDVVKVKNGYARNFLIPQGKAKRVTEAAVAVPSKACRAREGPGGDSSRRPSSCS